MFGNAAAVDQQWHDRSPKSLCADRWIFLGLRVIQCLRQIRKNVVNVLDAHAEAQHLRRDAGLLLLFGRKLAVRGGSWMAGERFRVAHIHHALEPAAKPPFTPKVSREQALSPR